MEESRMMSDGEIYRDWKNAKMKNAQIGILAQLNCMTNTEIKAIIVKEQNKESKHDKLYQNLRESRDVNSTIKELNDELNNDDMENSTYKAICARLDELDALIKGYTKEYKKLSDLILKHKV